MNSLFREYLAWCLVHGFEILGTITGLIYLYFSIRQKLLLWLFGILNAIFLLVVYWKSGIYAYMLLQIYYLVVSVYGWIHWVRGNPETHELPFTRLNASKAFLFLAVSLAIGFAIYFLLRGFTDSDIPWLDAMTTAFSITATWMLARKILEHWLVWIVVDSVLSGLYVVKHLYPMVLLFLVYTVMAVYGYSSWKKTIPAAAR